MKRFTLDKTTWGRSVVVDNHAKIENQIIAVCETIEEAIKICQAKNNQEKNR